MRAQEFITEKKKRKRKLKGAAWGPGPYGVYGFATGYSGEGGTVGEASYSGNIGIMELSKFFQVADVKKKNLFKHLVEKGKKGLAWKLVQDTLNVKLQGKEFEVDEGWKDIAAAGALGTALALGGGNAQAQDIQQPQQQTTQAPGWQEQVRDAIKDGDVPNGNEISVKRVGNWVISVTVDGKTYDIEHRLPARASRFVNGLKQLKKSMGNESLEEKWQDWVVGAGLGAMALGGGSAAYDAYKSSQSAKEPTAVVAKSNFKKGVEKLAKDAVPKQSVTGSPHEKFLTQAAVDAGIKGEELAQFLGQTAHESHNFKTMVEYGDSKYFKKYEPKFAKDKKTKKVVIDPKTKKPKNFNPKAEVLGNDMPGDGEKYKGRGYIQLTGKYNYAQAGKALGLDLVKNPQLVEKPEVAAKVAVWFWQNRVQPKVSDFGDTRSATKPINPGLKHLDQRKEKFGDFKTAMR
jgi:predicted chitinase